MLLANTPLTSMLKILLDPIINHTICSSSKTIKFLQLCFWIYRFYNFATKSIQNTDPLHKILEKQLEIWFILITSHMIWNLTKLWLM